MSLKVAFLAFAVLQNLFGLCSIVDSALPFGIFPFLTSGWYYKPNPAESVVLGLIVVKVLAIRLASVTGILPIPYHLNDLFIRTLGKRSIQEYFVSPNLTLPTSSATATFPTRDNTTHYANRNSTLDSHELTAMFRVLLGIRRIDVNDCFLKNLCFLSQDAKRGTASLDDRRMLQTLRYLILMEGYLRETAEDKLNRSPVMDVYEKSLDVGGSTKVSGNSTCSSTYMMCTLTKKALQFQSVISELF